MLLVPVAVITLGRFKGFYFEATLHQEHALLNT
jgi:hypothetical protein